MPYYDYNCTSCGKTHEAFQKINDDHLKACPHCHSESLVRGIGGSSTAFCFKGNGFYITDYKDSPPGGGGKCGCTGSHSC